MVTDVMHYLNFVMMVFFAFGLCFEIPVSQMVLAAVGIVDLQKLKRRRRYAIVGACVVAQRSSRPTLPQYCCWGSRRIFCSRSGSLQCECW